MYEKGQLFYMLRKIGVSKYQENFRMQKEDFQYEINLATDRSMRFQIARDSSRPKEACLVCIEHYSKLRVIENAIIDRPEAPYPRL